MESLLNIVTDIIRNDYASPSLEVDKDGRHTLLKLQAYLLKETQNNEAQSKRQAEIANTTNPISGDCR
jgi:hypothetical protein